MGGFLDKPKTEKSTMVVKTDNFRVARTDMQGYREEMEDASIVECDVSSLPGWSFFGVFDGHAGSKVAQLASQSLLSFILKTTAFERLASDLSRLAKDEKEQRKLVIDRSALLKRAIGDAFLAFDEHVRSNVTEIREGKDKSGCTAVCAFSTPTHLIIANCGDSRAVLLRDGKVVFASEDHKPSRETEKRRIEQADGFILLDRVNGELAVSRALGDFDYKANKKRCATEQLVSGEPDVTVLERTAEDILVLACDGVWDVLSNDDVAVYFEHRFAAIGSIGEIAEETLDACLARGSKDNMTLVLVAFGADTSDDDTPARRAERELNEKLEQAVRDYLNSQLDEEEPHIEQGHVVNRLALASWQNLPPAIGFVAKRFKVAALYDKVSKEMEPQMAACRARVASQSESDTLVSEPRSDDETEFRSGILN